MDPYSPLMHKLHKKIYMGSWRVLCKIIITIKVKLRTIVKINPRRVKTNIINLFVQDSSSPENVNIIIDDMLSISPSISMLMFDAEIKKISMFQS